MIKLKRRSSCLGVFFLAAILFFSITPAAQSQFLDIDAVLEDAKAYAEAKNVDSIVDLAAANPNLAVEIAQIAVEALPAMATDIACRIAAAARDLAIDVAVSIAGKFPENAVDIAACVADVLPPEYAPAIAAGIANAVPHEYAPDIAAAVSSTVPDWAGEITGRVIEVAPEYAERIEAAVSDAIAFEEEVAEDRVPPPAPPAAPYGQ